MSDIGSLVQVIITAYSESDNTIRNQAVSFLNSLREDYPSFCAKLNSILTSQHEQQVKEFAATLLRNSLREKLEEGLIHYTFKIDYAKLLFQTLCDENVPKNVRNILSYTLSPLIADSGSIEIFKLLLELASQGLELGFSQKLGSLVVLRVVITAHPATQLSNELLQPIVVLLENVGKTAWNECSAGISNYDYASTNEKLELLDEWSFSVKRIIDHFELTENSLMKETCVLPVLSDVLLNIIAFRIPDSIFPSGSGLFSVSNTSLCVSMNSIKYNILSILNSIFQYLIDSKKKNLEDQGTYPTIITLIGVNLPDSPFLSAFYQVLELLIAHLIEFFSIDMYPELLQSSSVRNLLIETMTFFHRACGESKFYSIFSQYSTQLMLHICIPILQFSEMDRAKFEENPEEFVNEAMDISERQESQSLKTETAKFFETLCDNIDGCLPSIVGFSLQLIQQSITSSPVEEFCYLNSAKEYKILYISPEIKVETSLLVLAILSYSVSRRVDLLSSIEHLLSTFYVGLQSAQSPIIQSRISLFFYFYAEYIFIEDDAMFQRWVEFIVSSLRSPSRSVSSQASETMSYILQDEELMNRMDSIIAQLIPAFVYIIPQQTEKIFFESLCEIVQNYSPRIKEFLPDLIRAVVSKILTELALQTQNKQSIIEIKCWNILRTIAEIQYVKENLQLIEELVAPLYGLMHSPAQIQFEDDLISMVLSMMRKTAAVSDPQWALLFTFPGVQAKQENALLNLFRPINYYISFGKETICRSPQLAALIVQMASQALFCEPTKKAKEVCHAQGAILYQLLFQHCSAVLAPSLHHMLLSTLQRYEQPRVNSFLTTRLLGVFLSGLLSSAPTVLEALSNSRTSTGTSVLYYIIRETIENSQYFSHSYDKRLLVLSLTSFLSPEVAPELEVLLPQILETLVRVLSSSSEIQAAQLLPAKDRIDELLENYINNMSDDDFDGMLDNEMIVKGTQMFYGKAEGFTQNQESEANISLSYIDSPVLKADEYEFFQGRLNALHSASREFVTQLISTLAPERKAELIEVLKLHRVKLSSVTEDVSVVRKIVKSRARGLS